MSDIDLFKDLYKRQRLYNIKVRSETHDSIEGWTKTYLLGLVSEVDAVLKELAWKIHRRQEPKEVSKTNLSYEFADLLKYVLSLFEVWGFSPEEVISITSRKSNLLETLWYEDRAEIAPGTRLIITDLDGTLADWRLSFRKFLEECGHPAGNDPETTMNIERELNLSYEEYILLKMKFESEGGYESIIPYRDGISFIRDEVHNGRATVVAFTDRPFTTHKRIWIDSWKWISDNNIPISQLRAGGESRILFATQYRETNEVILLDDNPELILRAANSGIRVIARRHAYNEGISHPLVTFSDDFSTINL